MVQLTCRPRTLPLSTIPRFVIFRDHGSHWQHLEYLYNWLNISEKVSFMGSWNLKTSKNNQRLRGFLCFTTRKFVKEAAILGRHPISSRLPGSTTMSGAVSCKARGTATSEGFAADFMRTKAADSAEKVETNETPTRFGYQMSKTNVCM